MQNYLFFTKKRNLSAKKFFFFDSNLKILPSMIVCLSVSNLKIDFYRLRICSLIHYQLVEYLLLISNVIQKILIILFLCMWIF